MTLPSALDAIDARVSVGLHLVECTQADPTASGVSQLSQEARDPVGEALRAALDTWTVAADPAVLRRELIALLARLA